MNRMYSAQPIATLNDLNLHDFLEPCEISNAHAGLRALVEELPRNMQDTMSRLVGQLNAAMVRERRGFERLIDALPDGYVVTNFQCKIEHANAAAGSVLQEMPQNMYGKSMLEFFCERSRSVIVQRLRLLALNSGEESQCSDLPACLVLADKSEISIALRLVVFRVEKSPSIRWILRRD